MFTKRNKYINIDIKSLFGYLMIKTILDKNISKRGEKKSGVVLELVRSSNLVDGNIQRWIVERNSTHDWFSFCQAVSTKLNTASTLLSDSAFNPSWTKFKNIVEWVEAPIVDGGIEMKWCWWRDAFRAAEYATKYSLGLDGKPNDLLERVEKVLSYRSDVFTVEEFHDAEINLVKKEYINRVKNESSRRTALTITAREACEQVERLTQDNEEIQLELSEYSSRAIAGKARFDELSLKHSELLKTESRLRQRIKLLTDREFETKIVRELCKARRQRDKAFSVLQQARLVVAKLNLRLNINQHWLYLGAGLLSMVSILFFLDNYFK